MGLSVRLETELGEPVGELVGDPTNILQRILRPYYDDQTVQCLRFIDWYGNFGDYRYLSDEVFELKIHSGPGYRIYFGLERDQVVLLVLGGDKSSQPRDIDKAKKLWKRYKQE